MKLRFENILDTPYKRKGYGVFSMFATLALIILTMVACAPVEQAANGASTKIVPAINETQLSSEAAIEPIAVAQTASVLMPRLNEGIKGVLAESKPLPDLEKAIIKAFEIPADDLSTTKYYYNYVDLNDDSVDELFVMVMGPYTSGSGGSTALHVLDTNDGYIINQTFTLINEPIIISDKVTKGCHEIIVYRSGGGAEGTYITMKSSDGQYQTVNEGTPLDSLEGVTGTAIISNDILKDIENNTYLPLGK